MTQNQRTAVTTVTFYDLNKPDMAVRADLALRTIEDALGKNCEVFVVDGGSSDSFVQKAKSFGANLYPQEGRGISRGQQQAISHANRELNPDTYILIEPEKAGLLRDYSDQIVSPVNQGLADIVLVGRTEGSMKTMTRMQRLTETKINEILSEAMGIKTDYCMAPRVWNSNVTPYFLNYTPIKNWDLFHGPVIDAMVDGKKIVPVAIPYVYPRDMISQEEGEEAYEVKRVNQLIEVTDFVRGYLARKALERTSPKS